MKNWYLIHSKPGKELVAVKNLEKQGFSTYLPVMSDRNRKQKPMFPRYLFVELSAVDDNWLPIRSTIGVSGIVMFGEKPASASSQLIDDIRQMEKYQAQKVGNQDRYQSGDRVVIKPGSVFSGYEGQFCKFSSKDRVIVLFSITGRSVRLSVKEKDLRHAV